MIKTQRLQTLEKIRAFLNGSESLGFEIPSREVAYDFILQQLRRFGHTQLGKTDKGLIRRYLCRITGLYHGRK